MLLAVSKKLDKPTISRNEFLKETGVNEKQITNNFDSYNNFVREAGLQPNPNTDDRRISEDDLYEAMYSTFIREKGITTLLKFEKLNTYCFDTYKRHWNVGKWKDALRIFKTWVEKEHPGFAYLDDLPNSASKSSSRESKSLPLSKPIFNTLKRKTEGRLIGAPLNFRGMETEPVNEMGVVFLFALVAKDLGFHVESIASDFPDCYAKRVIDSKGRRESVKVEFEFESRNYNHPPTCDYIVCWEDNWDECPANIEVIELKKEIRKLKKDQ